MIILAEVASISGILVTLLLSFIAIRIPGFINKVYVMNFFLNALFGAIINIYFIKIAIDSHTELNESSNCMIYIISWFIDVDILIIGNLSIMFYRFIYIKFAYGKIVKSFAKIKIEFIGLIENGVDLFHKIIIIVISMFTTFFVMNYPISGIIR